MSQTMINHGNDFLWTHFVIRFHSHVMANSLNFLRHKKNRKMQSKNSLLKYLIQTKILTEAKVEFFFASFLLFLKLVRLFISRIDLSSFIYDYKMVDYFKIIFRYMYMQACDCLGWFEKFPAQRPNIRLLFAAVEPVCQQYAR